MVSGANETSISSGCQAFPHTGGLQAARSKNLFNHRDDEPDRNAEVQAEEWLLDNRDGQRPATSADSYLLGLSGVCRQTLSWKEVKKLPAHYDDVLTVRTTVTRTSPIRIEHKYEVSRDGTLLAEGFSTLACVGRDGKLRKMPAWLSGEPGA